MKRAMRMLVVSMVAVLAINTVASAVTGYPEWRGTAGDNMWTTAGNWDTGTVPTASDNIIYILGTGSAGAIIDTSVNANLVNVGYTSGINKLVVANGGSATFATASSLGYWGYNGALQVDAGGTFSGEVYVGGNGWGDFIVRGTANCNAIAFKAGSGFGGRVDVQDGGTFTLAKYLMVYGFNTAAEGAMFNVSGTGKLLIETAQYHGIPWNVASANAWANAGYITGNGLAGEANILAQLVDIGGVQYTQVTAVPEPVTLALLAAGGLFLRRKA